MILAKVPLAALAALAVTAAAAMPQPAKAALMLMLEETGFSALTITDNGSGDGSSVLGRILFDGSYGTFTITTDIGSGYPLIGSPAFPQISLTTNDVVRNGSMNDNSSLRVSITEDGFTNFGPTSYLLGSTAIFPPEADKTGPAPSVTYTFLLDNAGGAFTGTALTPAITFNAGPLTQASSTTAIGNPDGNYSLTTSIFLSGVDRGVNIQAGSTITAVPEPMSLALFGAGLLGLGLAARRRKKASATSDACAA